MSGSFFKNNFYSICAFLSIGLITAILYFSAFTFFWKFIDINYKTSVTLAYIFAITFQFLSNRHITFRSSDSGVTSQVLKYFILVSLNYLITYFVVAFIVEVLNLSPYLGIIASIIITFGIGFLLSKFWIFRSTSLEQP
jgi:putative flippase GtrA